MANEKVTVKVLNPKGVRDENQKLVPIGKTMEVLKTTADILVENEAVELVEEQKATTTQIDKKDK